MIRSTLFAILVTTSSACVGDIIGGSDPNDPNDPNDPGEPTTEVKVTVRDRTSPLAAMPVIFQRADDSVIAETTTGTDGSAIADMPDGGTVTIIRLRPDDQNGNPQSPELFTYVGVKPGDVLELQRPSGVATAPQTIIVKVPPNELGVATVTSPCGSGTGAPPDIQVAIDGCATGAEIGFYVTDASTTSFYKRAILAPTVDLSSEAYRDQLATTITATNPPGEVSVTLEKRLEGDGFAFFTSPPAPGPTADITTPDTPGAEQVIAATLSSPSGTQTIAHHDPFAAAPATMELLVDSIAFTSPATVAPDGTLTWTETGSGIPDIVVASYSIAREGTSFTRSVAAPHTGATLRLPKLPATYDSFNLLAGDQATAAHQLAKFSTSYDDVRERVFNARLSSIAPMGGRVAVSYPAGQAEVTR